MKSNLSRNKLVNLSRNKSTSQLDKFDFPSQILYFDAENKEK